MDKNRFFNEKEIIPFINSRFSKSSININQEGIRLILKNLVEKNFIKKGSKLTKEEILLNSNRKNIFDFIKNNPGKYFYSIVKELKMSIPVVGWHLRMLEEFNFIINERFNGYEAYFDCSIPRDNRKILFLLSKDKPKQIIEFLARNNKKGITKIDLSKELNMSRNTISKYIEELCKINVLKDEMVSNKTVYSLKEDYYTLMLKSPS